MKQRPQAGFTLLEILLAVAITSFVMTSVGMVFLSMLQTREEVTVLTESTEAGPRILQLVERDLQGLWHHNIKGNKVLRGRNMDIAGIDADRIDFLTTTDAVGLVQDQNNESRRPTVCEVGYWIKRNEQTHDLFELWRREDPMVDDDLLTGGEFQLVHDRVKSFNITYYASLGSEAEELVEWDSSVEDLLPRRIKFEFTIERKLQSSNQVTGAEVEDFEEVLKKYVRHVVLDPRLADILKPGIAMVPVLPPTPAEESGGGGPPGPGGAGGNRTADQGADAGRTGRGPPPRGTQQGRGLPPGAQPPGVPLPPGRGGNIDLGNLLRGTGGRNPFGPPPSGNSGRR
jgi:prepilin-type N-terminal cleavage/methylation domain-containing protein